jgi:trehalose 6-phosphate phosphatase
MGESVRLPTPYTPAVPPPWKSTSTPQAEFLQELAHAPTPLLICDYDGTLAPFKTDKMQAYPYAGVPERLEGIANGRTRIAFVSGRPVAELIQLLPLAAKCEIWGMHGREHRSAAGAVRRLEPSIAQRTALDAAEHRIEEAGFASLIERKTASVALHWRSLEVTDADTDRLARVQALAQRTFSPYAGRHSLSLLPFDGGLELRAHDHTKGHATEALLAEFAANHTGAAAFLGDDTTDEDAFRAMREHGGLGLLVRHPPRASYAHFSLNPPEELLAFLDSWLQSSGGTVA